MSWGFYARSNHSGSRSPLEFMTFETANRYPLTAGTLTHPKLSCPPSQRLGLPKVFMG